MEGDENSRLEINHPEFGPKLKEFLQTFQLMPDQLTEKKVNVKNEELNIEKVIAKSEKLNVTEEVFKCRFCDKVFCERAMLSIHYHRKHIEVLQALECDMCGAIFDVQRDLITHFYTHCLVKPFKCESCLKRFTRKGNLNVHMANAHIRKPKDADLLVWSTFMCAICKRSYKTKQSLHLHQRYHKIHPYICEICKKAFMWKNLLEDHIRIHTGEKPFVCEVCHTSFRREFHLRRHFRRHILNSQRNMS